MKLVFFGAPGAGKGTVAANVTKEWDIPQLSTGDLFRAAIKNKTELGKKVTAILDAGDLVPDEVTVGVVQERVKQDDCNNGYILDGFPRTIPQAEAWEKIDPIDTAIYFDISDEEVISRLGGRRVCTECGAIFNINFEPKRPKKEGICDLCGGDLMTRPDDQADAIKNRLEVYHSQTKPLLELYTKLGKCVTVDSSISPGNTFNQIKEKLG
jgi:adenylate kinase